MTILSRSTVVRPGTDPHVLVQRLGTDAVEVRFIGEISAADTELANEAVHELLSHTPAKYVLIDTTLVTRYSADVRAGGVAMLKTLKAAGVTTGACAAQSSAVRMMAAAVAFVASMRIDFVASRDEALASIERQRLNSN